MVLRPGHVLRFRRPRRRERRRSTARPATSAPPRTNPKPPDQAFLDDWLLRSCEIVDKYQPQVVYFDWWICQPVFQPYLQRFAAYYYNRGAEWGKPVAINFKEWEGRSFPDGTGVFDIERGQSADIRPDFWQTCTSVSKNSWGYVTNHDYKDVGDIVDDLIDIVSKNGTMLLNIGPQPDGTIPDERAGNAPRDRRLARRQRRSHLRHAAVEEVRRRSDANRRRLVRRREAAAVHRRRFPLHHQGRHALRHRARLARRTASWSSNRSPVAESDPVKSPTSSCWATTATLVWQQTSEGLVVDAPGQVALRLRSHFENRRRICKSLPTRRRRRSPIKPRRSS